MNLLSFLHKEADLERFECKILDGSPKSVLFRAISSDICSISTKVRILLKSATLVLGLAMACAPESDLELENDVQEGLFLGDEDVNEDLHDSADQNDQDQVPDNCSTLGIEYCVPPPTCTAVTCDPASAKADEYGCVYTAFEDGAACEGDDLKKEYQCENSQCVGEYKEGFVAACYQDGQFIKGKRVGGEHVTDFYDGFLEQRVPLRFDGKSLLPPGVEELQIDNSPWASCVCHEEGSVLGENPDVCLAETASCDERLLQDYFADACTEAGVDCTKPLSALCTTNGDLDEDCFWDIYQKSGFSIDFLPFASDDWYKNIVALQPCPDFDGNGNILGFRPCLIPTKFCDDASSICLEVNSDVKCEVTSLN